MGELTASQLSYAERAQHALGLGDWRIAYRFSDADGDACGHVLMKPEYRDAVVTIHTRCIEEVLADGFNETVERVILHELCEVAMAETDHAALPEWMFNSPPCVAARDLAADKLARTCERLGLVA